MHDYLWLALRHVCIAIRKILIIAEGLTAARRLSRSLLLAFNGRVSTKTSLNCTNMETLCTLLSRNITLLQIVREANPVVLGCGRNTVQLQKVMWDPDESTIVSLALAFLASLTFWPLCRRVI